MFFFDEVGFGLLNFIKNQIVLKIYSCIFFN
jgi:hypothetical protein